MNEKIEFAHRLVLSIKEAGYVPKASVLEREFNQRYLGKPVSLQATCRWLKGETIPTQEKLIVLADWLKTEPHLLRYGSRIPSHNHEREVKGSIKKRLKPVSKSDLEIWESFISLPASQKKIIKETIQEFSKAK